MAGTLRVKTLQLGDNATATQNFVWTENSDGTAKLARGNVGATTQDILTVDANGKVIVAQGMGALPATQSQVFLAGNSGYGSTNTAVRRWTTPTTQGTDLSYTDSATLGGSVTVNTAGVYAITYNDQLNVLNGGLAIAVNQTTFGSASINQPVTSSSMGANLTSPLSVTMYLAAGSVVRAIATSPAGASPNYTAFLIVRVA